jgi:RHS repeat-associated protein
VTKGATTFFYHQDGLGSVTDLTDSAGATAKSYSYDAYGNILDSPGTVDQPYTYTGRELDQETGLSYYRARTYDSAVGRFIQKDPIGLRGGLNVYEYTQSSPTNLSDPLGNCPWCVAGALAGLTDLSTQLLMNGFRIECVSWTQVGLSALGGAAGVGIAQKFAQVSTVVGGASRPTYRFFKAKNVGRIESHPIRASAPDWASYSHWHLDGFDGAFRKYHLPLIEPLAAGVSAAINLSKDDCGCSAQ